MRRRQNDIRAGYTIRAQGCLIATLLLAIGTVQLWPLPNPVSESPRVYRTSGQETIAIEEILQTRQQNRKPPPPPPLVPVVVSDDEIIDDATLELPIDFLAFSQDDSAGDAQPQGDTHSAPPELLEPRPVRIVEPEYTRDARRRKIRAEVVVEVMVDERGRVSEARVVDRYLLGKDEEREQVGQLGFGLEESAIDAAQRWVFRPARFGGENVRATTKVVFSFGV